MKNDAPGQFEIILSYPNRPGPNISVFAQAEKKEIFISIWFYVLHEGNACDCWFCVLKNFSRMRATKICQ